MARFDRTGSPAFLSRLAGESPYDTAASTVGSGVAVDGAGNTWVTGRTPRVLLPRDRTAFQPFFGGDADAFVSRLDMSGELLYSTYLGG